MEKQNQIIERLKVDWDGLAKRWTEQFIQREDLFAIQLQDGRYACIKSHFHPRLMRLHLQGKLTLGGYLLNPQSRTRQVIFDADDHERFEQLKSLAQALSLHAVPAYLETSRRGGHLRLFFPESIRGHAARSFGLYLMRAYGLDPHIELYPKQEALGDGPGSLVRLPLGVHKVTGRRYGFVQPDGSSLGSFQEQVEELAHPLTVPLHFVEANQAQPERAPVPFKPVDSTRLAEPVGTSWERIKARISVYDFVRPYVDLRPVASGYLGRCPFHDDRHPSFGVNLRGNYWNCFAGCGGGSVIDFWMLLHGIDFKTAVSELERMLLGGANE